MLYLASKSPQRKALLDSVGIEYEVIAPEYEEEDEGDELPAELVERHSRGKAWSVVAGLRPLDPRTPILGVDTIVVINGRAVGKPDSEEQALELLRWLSGSTHVVFSGVSLVWADGGEGRDAVEAGGASAGLREQTDHAWTEVRFGQIPEREMGLYVASGEWQGRAGGYAIQGRASAFVEEIRGDYTNVVGLPVPLLVRMLRATGYWPPEGWGSTIT